MIYKPLLHLIGTSMYNCPPLLSHNRDQSGETTILLVSSRGGGTRRGVHSWQRCFGTNPMRHLQLARRYQHLL